MGPRSVGVEEELLLVDPDDGRALAVASAVLDDAAVNGSGETLAAELTRQQIETNTRPCTSLNELGSELRRWRAAAEAARAGGAHHHIQPAVPGDGRQIRPYRRATAHLWLSHPCGGRLRRRGCGSVGPHPRLPTLPALSGNSPFSQGEDTGYASFRSQMQNRWPSAGSTELFGSAEVYHATVRAMIESGALIDEGMIYFNARLSRQYPTVEVRVADVCQCSDDAVLLAGLTRALVETAARAWRADQPPAPFRVELLRLAGWRAGRSGLAGSLIDPTGRPAPAQRVVRALIEHIRPALEDLGDYDAVQDLADGLRGRGNGATLQRDVSQRGGSLADVVASAVTRTAGS